MPKKLSLPKDYKELLEEIKSRVRSAQYHSLKTVNRELISLCWDIGRIAVHDEYIFDFPELVDQHQERGNKIKPEYIGKIQFYLAALDDRVRLPRENPSIGVILCRSKKQAMVEYALRESRKPIGVGTYRIFRRLPEELKGQLKKPKQIERLLEAVELPKGEER